MKCPRCQHENEAGAKFCEECASPLARTCANCGRQLSATAKFCPDCAHPTGLALTIPATERFGSPQAYTPKHLAEKILTSKALEGERKQVTVLFADLKGSMELLADRDPEEARKVLDPVLERMMEAVHRYEGTVNQVMGDGIMALFGAPLAHEDHAVRACYAALRMQETVGRYGDEIQRSGAMPVQIRVGLNSGEVVVRSIGSDLRMDYTAVGQTTHLAARMEQIAKAGSVLITGETLKLAEGYVQVKPLGSVPVKGLTDPVEVHQVTGAGPVRTRFQAAAARGLTRFVGRQTEIDILTQTLKRVRAGHGEVVALVGEPGVGKSRLVWEFTHSPRTDGWLMLESGSVSYGKATAYRPVIDLLKAYFQVEERDESRRISEKVTGKLLTLDRALEPALPALLSLLDVPVDDAEWQALDPPQRRQRTLDACKRLILRESQLQPLVLVFEDLHWIDTETQAFLDGLVDSVPTSRILLLVNYRPEYPQAWANKSYYAQLHIDPLPPESADELLRALLGEDPALRSLKRLLIERTEGNPFFLEESARTLVETHVLLGQRGAYRLARDLATIQVPNTVQAVLAARIDRLPPEDKHLLQTAAVIGKDAPFALLQAIADLPEPELRRGLSRLQTAEFLYEASLFPDLEYTFKHALTHEVSYAGLLHERQRTLHARVLAAIERLYAERLPEQVDRLAHHALQSELWEKAFTYLRQAGAKAASRSAYREAVAYLEKALEALRHLPETRERLEQAVDLRLDLRNALLPLGEHLRVLASLTEAEPLARALDDRRRLGWVYAYMTPHSWFVGDYDRAVEAGQRALAIAEALEERALQVMTNFFLSLAYFVLGRHREAVDGFRRNVAILQGALVHERFAEPGLPSVFSRCFLAWSLAELGEFAEGIAIGEEAIRIAEGVDQPFTLMHACLGFGMLRLLKGDVDEAARFLDRTLEICQRWDIPFWVPEISSGLGFAHALAGRVTDGLPLLERAHAEEPTRQVARGLIAVQLGEGYLLAGRREDASGVARRALDLCRQYKTRGSEAYALQLLGAAAARQDPPDIERADERYLEALALAEELRMRPIVAHCHLGLGKLYAKTGQRDQAREHLTTATTMYREMDMRFWLEQAEAEMRALA